MLSNFGIFAGRYATPIINPPCVAIVAAGVLRNEVVPALGGIEVHRTLPLSLTFDHRACTGGEAARFFRAMIKDLSKAEERDCEQHLAAAHHWRLRVGG